MPPFLNNFILDSTRLFESSLAGDLAARKRFNGLLVKLRGRPKILLDCCSARANQAKSLERNIF
jgi:hypothetical protein